jgi:hypothetical protein
MLMKFRKSLDMDLGTLKIVARVRRANFRKHVTALDCSRVAKGLDQQASSDQARRHRVKEIIPSGQILQKCFLQSQMLQQIRLPVLQTVTRDGKGRESNLSC